MPKVILSGRGGSGKSTLVCLLSSVLREQGEVLVVDIDESNLGLGKMLGVETPEKSLMDYLGGKPAVQKKLIAGFTQKEGEKTQLIEEKLTFQALPAECVTWNNGLGFLRVGKIEHTMEGCACPMGAISRAFLKQLEVADNQWVLIDTEAGVEHFGRGVVEGADAVIAVVDPSHDAVLLAVKIKELAVEAGKRFLAVINKADETIEPILKEELRKRGIEVGGTVTFSPSMNHANLLGQQLPADSLRSNIQMLLEKLAEKPCYNLAISWKNPQFWAAAWQTAKESSLYARQLPKRSGKEWWSRRAGRFAEQTNDRDLPERVSKVMHMLGHKNIFSKEASLLDIGAGPGNYTLPLVRRLKEGIALEPAEEMLHIFRQRAEEQGISNAQGICREWEDIDLEKEGWAGKFDIVLALMTPALCNVENLQKMLKACRGVFLAGGHLHREEPLRRELWNYLGLGERPEICPDIFYVFNWLYASGYYPDLEMEHYHYDRELKPEEAVLELQDSVFPYLEIDSSVQSRIEEFVNNHIEDGIVRIKRRFVAAWTICSLKNGYAHEHHHHDHDHEHHHDHDHHEHEHEHHHHDHDHHGHEH